MAYAQIAQQTFVSPREDSDKSFRWTFEEQDGSAHDYEVPLTGNPTLKMGDSEDDPGKPIKTHTLEFQLKEVDAPLIDKVRDAGLRDIRVTVEEMTSGRTLFEGYVIRDYATSALYEDVQGIPVRAIGSLVDTEQAPTLSTDQQFDVFAGRLNSAIDLERPVDLYTSIDHQFREEANLFPLEMEVDEEAAAGMVGQDEDGNLREALEGMMRALGWKVFQRNGRLVWVDRYDQFINRASINKYEGDGAGGFTQESEDLRITLDKSNVIEGGDVEQQPMIRQLLHRWNMNTRTSPFIDADYQGISQNGEHENVLQQGLVLSGDEITVSHDGQILSAGNISNDVSGTVGHTRIVLEDLRKGGGTWHYDFENEEWHDEQSFGTYYETTGFAFTAGDGEQQQSWEIDHLVLPPAPDGVIANLKVILTYDLSLNQGSVVDLGQNEQNDVSTPFTSLKNEDAQVSHIWETNSDLEAGNSITNNFFIADSDKFTLQQSFRYLDTDDQLMRDTFSWTDGTRTGTLGEIVAPRMGQVVLGEGIEFVVRLRDSQFIDLLTVFEIDDNDGNTRVCESKEIIYDIFEGFYEVRLREFFDGYSSHIDYYQQGTSDLGGSSTGGTPTPTGGTSDHGNLTGLGDTSDHPWALQTNFNNADWTTPDNRYLNESDAGDLATQDTVGNSDWSGTALAIANGGTGATNDSDARNNLGLQIGQDVQAHDAQLDTLSGFSAGQVAHLDAIDQDLGTGDPAAFGALDIDDINIDGNTIQATSGNLVLDGNGNDVLVNGDTIQIDKEMTTTDNLVVLNEGETGSGITAGTAGLQFDRGPDTTDYQILFQESNGLFSIGEVGDLQAVMTREDSPTDTGLHYWDEGNSRSTTSSDLTFDGSIFKAPAASFSDRVDIINGNYNQHIRLQRSGAATAIISPIQSYDGGVNISLEEEFGSSMGRLSWVKRESENTFILLNQHENSEDAWLGYADDQWDRAYISNIYATDEGAGTGYHLFDNDYRINSNNDWGVLYLDGSGKNGWKMRYDTGGGYEDFWRADVQNGVFEVLHKLDVSDTLTGVDADFSSTGTFGGMLTAEDHLLFEQDLTSDSFDPAGDLIDGFDVNQAGEVRTASVEANAAVFKSFTAEVAQLFRGELSLTKSFAEIAEDFTIPAENSTGTLTVYDVEGYSGFDLFGANDIVEIRLKDESGDGLTFGSVFGEVTNVTDNGDGTQSWDFETLHVQTAALEGMTAYKGSEARSYGSSSSPVGVISDSVFSNVPHRKIYEWSSNPWEASNRDVIYQHGDLDELEDPDLSGIGVFTKKFIGIESLLIGDYTKSGDPYLEVDGTDITAVDLNLDITIDSNNSISADGSGVDIRAELFELESSNAKIGDTSGWFGASNILSYSDTNGGEVGLSSFTAYSDYLQGQGVWIGNNTSRFEDEGRILIGNVTDGTLPWIKVRGDDSMGGQNGIDLIARSGTSSPFFTIRSDGDEIVDISGDQAGFFGAIVDAGAMWAGASSKTSTSTTFINDWDNQILQLGPDASSITATSNTGIYLDGTGVFNFAIDSSNYIRNQGSQLRIETDYLKIDTPNFALDTVAETMNLGSVFSADGSNDEGQIASLEIDGSHVWTDDGSGGAGTFTGIQPGTGVKQFFSGADNKDGDNASFYVQDGEVFYDGIYQVIYAASSVAELNTTNAEADGVFNDSWDYSFTGVDKDEKTVLETKFIKRFGVNKIVMHGFFEVEALANDADSATVEVSGGGGSASYTIDTVTGESFAIEYELGSTQEVEIAVTISADLGTNSQDNVVCSLREDLVILGVT